MARLQTLVLGHLSEHNNHPEIVRMSAMQALGHRSLSPNWLYRSRADTIGSVLY